MVDEKDAEKGEKKEPDSLECNEVKKIAWRHTTAGRICVGFWSVIGFIVLLPIFIALFLVACVVWIVLAPFKCCCPCCAPCLMAITEGLFGLAKLPKKILTWIVSDDVEEDKDEKKDITEDKKSDYGTSEEKAGETKQ